MQRDRYATGTKVGATESLDFGPPLRRRLFASIDAPRAVGVSWITISHSPGHCGASFFQNHVAMFSIVGFSKPATSVRDTNDRAAQ